MTTTSLQFPLLAGNQGNRSLQGPATGNWYMINQLGQVTVDSSDAPYLQAQGAIPLAGSVGGGATSGNALIDFGAFPGIPMTQLVVAAADISDPAAVLDAWIAPLATADHTSDEHLADPPRVLAINTTPGTSFTIYGFPSGRDLPVPPGTPFGQVNTSQMPVGQQQLMPYGKWNVGWAFSP